MQDLFLGVLLVSALTGLAGCTKAAPAEKKVPPNVTVAKPESQQVTKYFEFPGRTAAVKEVEIRARVTGYLDRVCFQDGQEVEAGDLLYVIDPRPYEAVLDRAKGELERLKAVQNKAREDMARSERLLPSGAVSADEYEQHRAQLQVNEASILVAEAAVREAQLNVDFTTIKAPIRGRVSRTRITEGNLVQAGMGDSMVLTTVVSTDPIYVYFDIDERALLEYEGDAWGSGRAMQPDRIGELKIPVEFGLDYEQGYPHVGVLDFVDNSLERQTGTIRARGIFDNRNRYLAPGLFVRVRIPFGEPRQALMISDAAIGTDQGLKYVLTVNQENVAEYRQVKLGVLRDGMREIESGISADDLVITKGLLQARAGKPVNPHFPEDEAAAQSASGLAGLSHDEPGAAVSVAPAESATSAATRAAALIGTAAPAPRQAKPPAE